MGLRSESQRELYPEIYQTPQEVKVQPSSADKFNLQPDRFGEMSSEDFSALVEEIDETSKKPTEVFQKPFLVDREKYRQYMLSQDETGELSRKIEELQNQPVRRFDLD